VLGDQPVGRSCVAWSPAECLIVDLALLPEYRSVGLGTVLVSETLERAERAGLPVRISVFRLNQRAIAFWMRMGFEPSGGDEMYLSFQRAPGSRPVRAPPRSGTTH
jgi:ribosomal protein S18 acetylase RimI-like enzyme